MVCFRKVKSLDLSARRQGRAEWRQSYPEIFRERAPCEKPGS